MKTRLSVALAAVLLASSLALIACNSSERGRRTPPAGGQPIVVSLDMQSQARAGETVPLRLTVRNVSDRPVELALTGQEADGFAGSKEFVVTLADGTEVWRWSHGATAVIAILSLRTLDSGEELVLEGEWDQRDDEGQSVGPGAYMVRGFLTEGDPSKQKQTLETAPSTLRISR